MKKIALYLFWTFICLHTTVRFSDAADSTIENAMTKIDAIIGTTTSTQTGTEFNSAPMFNQYTPIYPGESQKIWSSWELMHRTPMLRGFTWTGVTANFITPNMYIGTPISGPGNWNMGPGNWANGYDPIYGPTTYTECVYAETDASFGKDGFIMETSVEQELMNIAKYCAVEFYGTYFEGKKYTTREEMLMLLFTMFDEGIELPGYFTEKGFVFDGEEIEPLYNNIDPRAWFAPYINAARELNMVPPYTKWSVAQKVTISETQDMINAFSEYRIYTDGVLKTGGRFIQTLYGYYKIIWDNGHITVSKNF